MLPGIEIDIDGGHALFIADSDKQSLDAFETICNQITPLVKSQDDTIPFDQIQALFHGFDDYLVIPHYDKEPKLPNETISKFGANIFAGEVCSVKKLCLHLRTHILWCRSYLAIFVWRRCSMVKYILIGKHT